MNKKKLIAAVICLVLVITAALPGTLAVSADAASSDGTISVATPETTQTPDDSVVTDDAAPQSESETPAEPKTCTCDPAPAEGEAHKEGCPLYVAPEKPDEEPDPKQTLFNLIRSKCRKKCYKEMLPLSGQHVGVAYNPMLCKFVRELWDPERAAIRSPSLNRSLSRVIAKLSLAARSSQPQ